MPNLSDTLSGAFVSSIPITISPTNSVHMPELRHFTGVPWLDVEGAGGSNDVDGRKGGVRPPDCGVDALDRRGI